MTNLKNLGYNFQDAQNVIPLSFIYFLDAGPRITAKFE